MDDTSINTRVLKMQKPPTAIHRIHQRPLMRSVDSRFTLSENNFIFVRTVNVFGTQGHLPASFHTTSRSQYVIPAIAFEKLWPLDGRMPFRFVKNNLAFPQQTACIPGHGAHAQTMFDARARPGISMNQIGPPVVFHQRTGINQTLPGLKQMRPGPFFGRMVCRRDINSLVRHGKENPEFPRIEADGRRPHPTPGLDLFIAWVRQIANRMIDERPVDQVTRMQNRQPRGAVKTRRCHEKIVSVPDHIRVGIISVENGIFIHPVTEVRRPKGTPQFAWCFSSRVQDHFSCWQSISLTGHTTATMLWTVSLQAH